MASILRELMMQLQYSGGRRHPGFCVDYVGTTSSVSILQVQHQSLDKVAFQGEDGVQKGILIRVPLD
jgi:hypothetical protein